MYGGTISPYKEGDFLPCYHPLKAFVLGEKDGKRLLKVTCYEVDHLERSGEGFSCCTHPAYGRPGDVIEFIEIPCGKCSGCRLQRSREWANRCMLELEYHKSSYFVTLTYDDAHVPIHYYSDPETGEALPSMSLVKRDFQLFMKRLRKKFGEGIRFFASGEYGSFALTIMQSFLDWSFMILYLTSDLLKVSNTSILRLFKKFGRMALLL